jgi:hypothetical protein
VRDGVHVTVVGTVARSDGNVMLVATDAHELLMSTIAKSAT